MAREFHPGEQVPVKVRLFQASGAETDHYDKITGILYTVTDPEAARVTDADAEPKDCVLEFQKPSTPSGQDQFLTIQLDGDPGDGEETFEFKSEAWVCVDGPVRSAEILLGEPLVVEQVEPPPPVPA